MLPVVPVTHPDRTEAAFLHHISPYTPAWACDCDGRVDESASVKLRTLLDTPGTSFHISPQILKKNMIYILTEA